MMRALCAVYICIQPHRMCPVHGHPTIPSHFENPSFTTYTVCLAPINSFARLQFANTSLETTMDHRSPKHAASASLAPAADKGMKMMIGGLMAQGKLQAKMKKKKKLTPIRAMMLPPATISKFSVVQTFFLACLLGMPGILPSTHHLRQRGFGLVDWFAGDDTVESR